MKAIFLRVVEANDKPAALRKAIRASEASRGETWFEVAPVTFCQVPRSPFAYWVTDRFRRLFEDLPALRDRLLVTSGTGTLDDFRFLRLWWETRSQNLWWPYAKGGAFAPYYFDHYLCVNWANEGREMKAWIVTRYGGGHWARNIRSTEHHFRPGLTWPRRTQVGLSLRIMPAGCIFADKGPAVFVLEDASDDLLALAAITNSRAFAALVELQMAFGSYEVGVLQRTPVPKVAPSERDVLAGLSRRAWSFKRLLDSSTETSHAFVLPPLLQVDGNTLEGRSAAWAVRVADVEAKVAHLQSEIDECCFHLYGIGGENRRQIEHGLGARTAGDGSAASDGEAEENEAEDVDATPPVVSLLSWALGVAFGRYDLRLVTGDREVLQEPDPFAPLPVCSPGMLTSSDGLPADTPPSGYPIQFPRDGILVDDLGHDRDLLGRNLQVFRAVFGDDADALWEEAAEILDGRERQLRSWFARSFFDDHIKRYSKSRRKAPIYWQLATPSASYSVWLYYHRFTRDTLFRVLNVYVVPKLKHEEQKLTNLADAARSNSSARQRKELDAQETFVEELRAFRQELERVAPLWNPNLDDGVIINFAPLWRLVPQSRSWQRECRKVWDKLAKGEYDWSHLAMHLWPERVLPKCTEDRSLAIAHDLEEDFWEEGGDGKWHPKEVDDATVRTLIEERSSAAVKAALDDLLGAGAR